MGNFKNRNVFRAATCVRIYKNHGLDELEFTFLPLLQLSPPLCIIVEIVWLICHLRWTEVIIVRFNYNGS